MLNLKLVENQLPKMEREGFLVSCFKTAFPDYYAGLQIKKYLQTGFTNWESKVSFEEQAFFSFKGTCYVEAESLDTDSGVTRIFSEEKEKLLKEPYCDLPPEKANTLFSKKAFNDYAYVLYQYAEMMGLDHSSPEIREIVLDLFNDLPNEEDMPANQASSKITHRFNLIDKVRYPNAKPDDRVSKLKRRDSGEVSSGEGVAEQSKDVEQKRATEKPEYNNVVSILGFNKEL